MSIRPQNIEIAKQLGITPEMVAYLRPRLNQAYYGGDTAKLISRILFHRNNSVMSMPLLKQARKKREEKAVKFAHHKEIHLQKAQRLAEATEWTEKKVPFYDAMIKFLKEMTPAQKQILLQEERNVV